MCMVIGVTLLILTLGLLVALAVCHLHQQSLEIRTRNAYRTLMYDAEATRNAILNEARRHRK